MWFNQFKNTRDDFVVHPYNTFWGTSTSGLDLEGISKISFSKKKLAKKLSVLREKYSNITNDPSFDTVLKKLEINLEKLEKKDREAITSIKKYWGTDFPSIDLVSKKIFEYMEFIEKEFK